MKLFSLEVSLVEAGEERLVRKIKKAYHFLGITAKSWWLSCCCDQFLRDYCVINHVVEEGERTEMEVSYLTSLHHPSKSTKAF